MEHTVTEERIDTALAGRNALDAGFREPAPYRFGRSDRIPNPQIKAIQSLYENFARDLGIGLSAYLRDYVAINVITVEQISFAEFLESLPSPTCLVSLRVNPFGECSVLELSPPLYSPVVEVLMGGQAKSAVRLHRKLTEIEQSVLDGLIRIILNTLRATWRPVYDIDFAIEGQETDPQVFRVLPPNDGVIAVAIEVRVGENVGMMNIAMNSLTVARMRDKFDYTKSYRKVAGADEQERRLRLFHRASLEAEAVLQGSPLRVSDLLDIEVGDVLAFDVRVGTPVDLVLNRKPKFRGQVVEAGRKRALRVEALADPSGAGSPARPQRQPGS